jgi:hypothetical protein
VLKPIPNEDLEDRKMIMKNILLELTNSHHKEFLNKIDFPREFDPFKLKTWHHQFNLDEDCPPVPIFEIQSKPTMNVTTINDFLRNNDITNALVKEALENYNRNEEDNTKSGTSITSASDNSFLSKVVSQKVIDKIRAKEEAVNIGKDIMEYSKSLRNRKENLAVFKEVCDKLKTIISSNSMKINEVISKLLQNNDHISQIHTHGIYK